MNIKTENIYERNELLWGKDAQLSLFKKHVVIFGLGGVGAYAAEALARSGVGKLTVVDFDVVSESNINRQLLATYSTLGRSKVELMQKRIEDINPHIQVVGINDFYTEKLDENIFSEKIDFVIDAIDTLKFKIDLIVSCKKHNIPIISSIGAGNRLNPESLFIADISEVKTRKCPFAKNVRYKLKYKGITDNLPVVFSYEKPDSMEKRKSITTVDTENGDRIDLTKFTPGSSPFVPPVAGYMMAAYVVRQFINN